MNVVRAAGFHKLKTYNGTVIVGICAIIKLDGVISGGVERRSEPDSRIAPTVALGSKACLESYAPVGSCEYVHCADVRNISGPQAGIVELEVQGFDRGEAVRVKLEV
jgi:hypothetical protein